MSDVLLIEPCDFASFPVGGQLSFAKQMMTAFGNRLALVGISTDGTQVGRWVEKRFDGQVYRFLAVGRQTPSSRRPFMPARVMAYLDIRKHKKQILSAGIRSVFAQSPETLMAICRWGWDSLCYRIAGCSNPLEISRYGWAKPFAGLYDKKLFHALREADVVLVSADRGATESLVAKGCGILRQERVIQFPTRVDTAVFHPLPKRQMRLGLGFGGKGPLVLTCGRVSHVKGWELLVQAFRVFARMYDHARLVFVGDGEDRPALERAIQRHGLHEQVTVVGFQPPHKVVEYLSAADFFVVASYREGWSLAMLEALACGKPIVTTDVSGARDLVVEGENGFVVPDRDPYRFARAMARTAALEDPNRISLDIADRYSIGNLGRDLAAIWKPLG